MPISKNPQASLADIRKVMDAALEAINGVVLRFSSTSARKHFKTKCYSIRANDRKTSLGMYQAGDPGHGVSEYDKIRLTDVNKEHEPIVDSSGENKFHLLLINVDYIEIEMYDGRTGELITSSSARSSKSPYDLS